MSLSSTLNVQIDKENDGSAIAVVLTELDRSADRSRYKFPSHSLISRDQVEFMRTFNKKSGNFNGVARSSVKLTRDVTVPGVDVTTSVTAPQIAQISFSNPVGTTPAQDLELAMRLVGIIIDNVIRPKLLALEV